MDRLKLSLAGCGLSLVMAAPGCKTGPEVPPGRAYNSDGRQAPPIAFSSDPHPQTGAALAGAPGANGPQFGTPPPATGNLGAPTANLYGAPGTSGSAGGGSSGLTAPPGGFNDPLASRASAASPPATDPAAPPSNNSTYYVPKNGAAPTGGMTNGDTAPGQYYTPGMTGPMFGTPSK
jgi:hypothetical protein